MPKTAVNGNIANHGVGAQHSIGGGRDNIEIMHCDHTISSP